MSRGGTYSYVYDNIGNRVTSREGSGASAAAYTANSLNQYTAMMPTATRQRFKRPQENGKFLIMP